VKKLMRVVPAGRRDWVEALWAEAHQVPAGWHRLSWLAGGVWLLLGEVALLYRLGYVLVFAGGVIGIVWVRVHNGSPVSALVGLAAVGVMLAVLPWFGRGSFGPVVGSRLARGVRLGGYATLLAFLVISFATARYGKAAGNTVTSQGDGPMWIVVLLLLTAYWAAILRLTSRRSLATTGTLAIGVWGGVGTGLALYALTPFGGALSVPTPWLAAGYCLALVLVPIGAPAFAGAAAARTAVTGAATARTAVTGAPVASVTGVQGAEDAGPADEEVDRSGHGIAAGGLIGGGAALVVAVLTLPTLMLRPDRVTDIRWSNPADASLPYPTPDDFAMSVSDSVGKYLAFVVVGPMLGMVLGWAGAVAAGADRSGLEKRRGSGRF
jgi:hypothetical protein